MNPDTLHLRMGMAVNLNWAEAATIMCAIVCVSIAACVPMILAHLQQQKTTKEDA